jgi:hypothetical protein
VVIRLAALILFAPALSACELIIRTDFPAVAIPTRDAASLSDARGGLTGDASSVDAAAADTKPPADSPTGTDPPSPRDGPEATDGPPSDFQRPPLKWARLPNTIEPHEAGSVVRDERYLYVFGRASCAKPDELTCSWSLERYDPVFDIWRFHRPLVIPGQRLRWDGHWMSAWGDGEIYLTGGRSSGSGAAGMKLAWRWCADADDLTPLPDMLYGRSRHAIAGRDGILYVLGGYQNLVGPAARTEVERFDYFRPTAPGSTAGSCLPISAEQTWKEEVALPSPRTHFAAVLLADGRLVAIGGLVGSAGREVVSAETLVLSPGGTSWVAVRPMPAARFDHAAVIGADGLVYVLGGQGPDFKALDTVVALDPGTGQWWPVPSLPVRLSSVGAAVGPDNRIYAVGESLDQPDGHPVVAYGPGLRLTPFSAGAGSVVSISLAGDSAFAPDAELHVYWQDTNRAPIATGRSNGLGAVDGRFEFVIPEGTAVGTYQVFVIDQKSRYPALARFEVK